MRFWIKLLGLVGLLGGTYAAATAIERRRRLPAPGAGARPADRMSVAPDVVVIEAEIIGLAEVDPEKLTQMGEGIDPELSKAAHEEIPEQRAKLPVRGKNVP
jgi:hypothetical protein